MKIEAETLRNRIAAFILAERETLFAFVVTRLFVWLIALAAVHCLKHGDYKIFPGNAPWLLLYHWDAFWYAKIVAHGYEYIPTAQSSVAFFPLLPLCIYALRAITGAGTALAGFLITNSALLGAAILLRRLVSLDFAAPSRVPMRTVWLLLLCPMTFFHSAIYTESLFLLFSVAAIYLGRKQQWLGAGISGALLTATRANGIFILIPLLWEALRSPPSSKALSKWWLCLVPLGVASFAFFLYLRFHAPFAFLTSQAAFHREAASPIEGFLIALRYSPPYNILFVGSAVIAVVLLLCGTMEKLRTSYLLFTAAMLILCLSTSIWESLPRYLSAVFPFYIVPAAVRSQSLYVLTLVASTAVMVFCLCLFAAGYFMT